MNQLKIRTAEDVYEGVEIPSSDDSVVMIKLGNGYNIGFSKDKIKRIETVPLKTNPPKIVARKSNTKLPTVTLVAVGGTIVSKVDYKTGGVYALAKPEELLASIPELASLVNIKVVSPFNIMSEDFGFAEWSKLASVVEKELNKVDVKGVIVTHGTDALHFTSAALSFALQDLNKPVAVVGAQKSGDRGSSDGPQNLICAAHYCLSDIAEVATVMHGSTEDTYCLANLGTKVRKLHCSRRDAFRPVNTLPLAKIWADGRVELASNFNKRNNKKTKLASKFDKNVALIKFTPGVGPEVIDFYIERGVKGIIIEATGMGHVSTQPIDKERSWIPAIRRAVKKGVFVGVAPQCIYGSVNSSVYTNLRILADTGAVFLNDMLPETAYLKLAWVLGQTKDKARVKDLMLANIAKEYNEHIPEESFMY